MKKFIFGFLLASLLFAAIYTITAEVGNFKIAGNMPSESKSAALDSSITGLNKDASTDITTTENEAIPTPQESSSPEPTTTPEPSITPEPEPSNNIEPEPESTPEVTPPEITATPEPTITPEPVTTPVPTPDPTPEPTPTPTPTPEANEDPITEDSLITQTPDGITTIDAWEGKQYIGTLYIRNKVREKGYDFIKGNSLNTELKYGNHVNTWQLTKNGEVILDNIPTIYIYGADEVETNYYIDTILPLIN